MKENWSCGLRGAVWDEDGQIPGLTEDGKPVIRGLFKTMDTYGIPLMMILDRLSECQSVPDWEDFARSAKAHGWKRRTCESRIHEALVDCYGPESKEPIRRLNLLLDKIYA